MGVVGDWWLGGWVVGGCDGMRLWLDVSFCSMNRFKMMIYFVLWRDLKFILCWCLLFFLLCISRLVYFGMIVVLVVCVVLLSSGFVWEVVVEMVWESWVMWDMVIEV